MPAAYTVINIALLGASALLFTWGMYLLLHPLLDYMSALLRTERRHRSGMKLLQDQRLRQVKLAGLIVVYRRLMRELELLLKATQKEDVNVSVQRFILLTISCGLSAGLISYFSTYDTRFSLFIMGLTSILPIMYYRLKLRSLQIQSGYDLAEVVGILTSKYKVTRGNMRIALQQSCLEIDSGPIRRHFMNLLREELNYVESSEMEKAVEEFIYSIQTSFAKQLGLTILKGLLRNENVESTLMAIDKNIHKQIDMLRDEGDSSSEVIQLSWLHVILFPLLLLMMVVFMGYNSTVYYQLGTEQGRFWLTVTVCFIVGSLMLAVWFRRPPNDY
ncbi:hypothetical protein [Paenibacillus radicis (ex Xue et al. 2023)]|uniref:Type II secretion system protein GspF domain-containing protein n=1 Tax=Paenibacillus radicis (ex Xue et al. 2023) TaxID=2972489 RepID=A0ABT1YT12_9BACL|nr:hypothetical protein [Paenibacillus radicis (ex Xue et al. 2023)]MCR8635840.1 hypothetical protein [Paenibacillus radicis (ex Xue et al. 2023)]